MSPKFKMLMIVGVIALLALAGCVPQAAPGAPVAAPTNAPEAAQPTAAPAAGAKPLNIAVIVKAVTSDYWKTVGAGVDAAMKTDPTIKASFLGPNEETDIEGQIRIIESQISAKVDALAVAPSQADQVQPTLEKAVKAGIPVVLIDTDLANFANKAAFVGTDNKLGGQLGGEFIVKALKAGDEVAIIRGAAGDPVHNLPRGRSQRGHGESRPQGRRRPAGRLRPCQGPDRGREPVDRQPQPQGHLLHQR